MMENTVDQSVDPVALLRAAVHAAGGQSQWARQHGLSRPYVNNVLAGRREPGDEMLAALGCQRVTAYVNKGGA